MSHYFCVDVLGKKVVRYLGHELPIIEGKYDFANYTKVMMLQHLRGGHPKEYYNALANALVIRRGAGRATGYTLKPIVNWPFDVSMTSQIISACTTLRKKYGTDEPVTLYTDKRQQVVKPLFKMEQVKPRTGIFVDIEVLINSMVDQDKKYVRRVIAPMISVALRVLMNVSNVTRPIVCYSDTFNVWEFISKYFQSNMLCYSGCSKYNSMFGVSDGRNSLSDLKGRIQTEPVFMFLSHGYQKFDPLFSTLVAPRICVITSGELASKLTFNHYECENYSLYDYNFPARWERIVRRPSGLFVFTDFYRDTDVYRITTKEEREMMMRHVYFASRVKVSGDGRLTKGFPIVADCSDTDVGFVGDTFVSGLSRYVSLRDGYVRKSRFYGLTHNMHVVEGSVISVFGTDRCDKIFDQHGHAFVYAISSTHVIRKRCNGRGVVVSVLKYRIYVYSSQVLSACGDAWHSRDYSKCAKYRIGRKHPK